MAKGSHPDDKIDEYGNPRQEDGVEQMALTKAELVEHLIARLGMKKQDARSLVDTFFETIKEALAADTTVKLSGFGSFDLRDKGQRPGRNPKTGENIPVTARRVVTFKPGPKLKTKVSQPELEQAR